MDVVVLLADAAQGGTHFLVLLVSELPRRDHVVGFEERVARHETVRGAPVIVSVRFKLQM